MADSTRRAKSDQSKQERSAQTKAPTAAAPELTGDDAVPLNWHHTVSQLGRSSGGSLVPQTRHAEAKELEQVARHLGVLSCQSLEAEYLLRTLHKGRVLLTGKLKCRVTQSCVVTLTPVEKTLAEDFELEFWPESQIAKQAEDEIEIGADELDERDIEPLLDDRIDVGRVVYEVVASGLDPYPRHEGAELSRAAGDTTQDDKDDDQASEHPFALLAKLKDGADDK